MFFKSRPSCAIKSLLIAKITLFSALTTSCPAQAPCPEFNYNAGDWTWMAGSKLVNQTGTFGNKGIAAPGNFQDHWGRQCLGLVLMDFGGFMQETGYQRAPLAGRAIFGSTTKIVDIGHG